MYIYIRHKMSDATIAFVVGRMNPPTPGHIKLIHDTITFAEEINATPLVYVTLSHNFTKMTKTQRSKSIVGLADKKDDETDLKPYVKHKSYENPLIPMMKKQLIQNMLFNKFGIPYEESDDVIRIDPECNGIFKAMQCVR